MKNCVSLETAKALKESGFVAPDIIAEGQLYYINNVLCTITSLFGGSNLVYTTISIGDHSGRSVGSDYYALVRFFKFAPSATDILAQMDTSVQLSRGRDGWICKKGEFFGVDICPHEAAAKMFIERKKYGHDKIQKSTKP